MDIGKRRIDSFAATFLRLVYLYDGLNYYYWRGCFILRLQQSQLKNPEDFFYVEISFLFDFMPRLDTLFC